MPDLGKEELLQLLQKRFSRFAHGKTAGEAVIGLMNKSCPEFLLKEAQISIQKTGQERFGCRVKTTLCRDKGTQGRHYRKQNI